MQKNLIVLAASAGLLAAAVFATGDLERGRETAAQLGRGMLAGILLGSGVWPYRSSPVPAALQAQLLQGPEDCPWQDGCAAYGLAATDHQSRSDGE